MRRMPMTSAIPYDGRWPFSKIHRIVGSVALAVGLATTWLTAAQQKPPTSPPKGATTFNFRCPDSLAEKACKSFEELWRAGDEGLRPPSVRDSVAYVCFRQPRDAFFVVFIYGPVFTQKHYDPYLKKLIPDDDASSIEPGYIRAFVDGIEDEQAGPVHRFSGEWTYLVGDLLFSAKRMDSKDVSDSDTVGFSIDPQQVSAAVQYTNQLGKPVNYKMVIQRSTGRFSEKYTEESEKVPFSETTGRCSKLPPP
jgi:hypothetical protein